jgi:tRNA 2-thiouridine synthesizing protein E
MKCQKAFATNQHGYLENSSDWTQAIANSFADQEGITLTEDHWAVITTLRAFYLQHALLPSMRVLIRLLDGKISTEKNTSLYLQSLFPGGLMRQGSKIAGLPKPVRCI